MSKKFSVLSCLTAVFAVALMAFAPAAFAHHSDDHTQATENAKGNDRKEGYEGNSKAPQEPNHGRNSDHDGDADADSGTTYTEDNDTNDGTKNNVSDSGDNRHPSGKDRSVENGGSGTQGRSESNPDDSKGPMRYEGAQGDDKANGPGGTDLADQDGNNGCGNDDDFDDDNNGWCGKPVKPADVSQPTCPDGSQMPASGKCDKPDEVQGGVITRSCDKDDDMANGIQPCDKPTEVLPDVDTRPSRPIEGVLGIRVSKAPAVAAAVRPAVAAQPAVRAAGAVLPFTGGEVLVFLAAAMALIAAGVLTLEVRSNRA